MPSGFVSFSAGIHNSAGQYFVVVEKSVHSTKSLCFHKSRFDGKKIVLFFSTWVGLLSFFFLNSITVTHSSVHPFAERLSSINVHFFFRVHAVSCCCCCVIEVSRRRLRVLIWVAFGCVQNISCPLSVSTLVFVMLREISHHLSLFVFFFLFVFRPLFLLWQLQRL